MAARRARRRRTDAARVLANCPGKYDCAAVTPEAVGSINQDEWVVGRVEELPLGSVTIVPLGKFGIGVFNVHGRYHALVNYCLR